MIFFRILIGGLAFLFVSCRVQAPLLRTDLQATGYTGNIATISTNHYYLTAHSTTEWQINDSTQPSRAVIAYFDKNGKLVREAVRSKFSQYDKIYDNTPIGRTGWRWVDQNGHTSSFYRIKYRRKGFVEEGYTAGDSSTVTSRTNYSFGSDGLVKTEKEKSFNSKGKLNYYGVNKYSYDRKGYLQYYTYRETHKSQKQKEVLSEVVVLARNEWGNPTRVLIKKDGRPSELKKIFFTYQ